MDVVKSEAHWIRPYLETSNSALLLAEPSMGVQRRLEEIVTTVAPIQQQVFLLDMDDPNSAVTDLYTQKQEPINVHRMRILDEKRLGDLSNILDSVEAEIYSSSGTDSVVLVDGTSLTNMYSQRDATSFLAKLINLTDFTHIYADPDRISESALTELRQMVSGMAKFNEQLKTWEVYTSDSKN